MFVGGGPTLVVKLHPGVDPARLEAASDTGTDPVGVCLGDFQLELAVGRTNRDARAPVVLRSEPKLVLRPLDRCTRCAPGPPSIEPRGRTDGLKNALAICLDGKILEYVSHCPPLCPRKGFEGQCPRRHAQPTSATKWFAVRSRRRRLLPRCSAPACPVRGLAGGATFSCRRGPCERLSGPPPGSVRIRVPNR